MSRISRPSTFLESGLASERRIQEQSESCFDLQADFLASPPRRFLFLDFYLCSGTTPTRGVISMGRCNTI